MRQETFSVCLFTYLRKGNSLIFLFSIIYACSFLLRGECCTFSDGEYVKAGLSELEHWCDKATEEVNFFSAFPCRCYFFIWLSEIKFQYAGSACDELKHIRRALAFLVLHIILLNIYTAIYHIYLAIPFLGFRLNWRVKEDIRWNKFVAGKRKWLLI